ncbi:MAG: CDGSH iron-sulfur domain-containing protein [Pseudomonadota bacterium]
MPAPVIAARKPTLVTLKPGRPVFWCACGRSAKQPFCDGSHKGTGFEPVKLVPDADGEALLCACKQTRNPPFCDGSHNNLSKGYAAAEPDAPDVRLVTAEERRPGVFTAQLDNGCFVARLGAAAFAHHGPLALAPVMDRAAGAQHLAFYSAHMAPGRSPVIGFASADVALFIVDGVLEVIISGRSFTAGPQSGVLVRPGEAFFLENAGDHTVKVAIAVCPGPGAMTLGKAMAGGFDVTVATRVVAAKLEKREAMADRFYQLLLDQRFSGCLVTQFIGEIPRSRAAHHRHLYEEAILILQGEGFLWTDTAKAAVKPGDMIFLPMRQAHSLECTSADGMRLMGVFYPSGSPAINY